MYPSDVAWDVAFATVDAVKRCRLSAFALFVATRQVKVSVHPKRETGEGTFAALFNE
jgi:hypothetical protein